MQHNHQEMGEPLSSHFPKQVEITAYDRKFFCFENMKHEGSLLSLPSGMYGWPITKFSEINRESLSQAAQEADTIDFFLIGTGLTLEPLPMAIATQIKQQGLPVEIMSTNAAIRTYNVMLAENRRLGAAFLRE